MLNMQRIGILLIKNLEVFFFGNSSLNSRIEAATYSAQMELYISGKEADLSKWDTAIKDYENEKSKCKDVYPLVKR